MRIELKSTPVADEKLPSSLNTSGASSMTSRIYSFANTEDRKCRFDADYQTPLGTTGKTATMGRRLLLPQKV